MGVKEIADKYIGRRGGDPKPVSTRPRRRMFAAPGTVTITIDEYKRLLEAAESDDMIAWCGTCGAWLDRDAPDTITSDCESGCAKVMLENGDAKSCKAHRVAK